MTSPPWHDTAAWRRLLDAAPDRAGRALLIHERVRLAGAVEATIAGSACLRWTVPADATTEVLIDVLREADRHGVDLRAYMTEPTT
jgi:hypothetical protein